MGRITREEIVKKGLVVILAGSDSDKAHISKITDELGKFGIPFDVRIASAHKQPEKVVEIVRRYDKINIPSLVYIAVAGGVDALSGVASYHSVRPVISCPPDGRANTTCLDNPSGSSNATIYNPKNVARFVAQMFSYKHSNYEEAIRKGNESKNAGLELADDLSKADMEVFKGGRK
jgi:5-(carboxyamino)imidazole ribonucleotide mutase